MNRTDRLYAIVEELRVVAPRPRSARWLADRFEVSSRTIERDVGALQQAGVPLYAEPGRTGGYVLDRKATLPPLNISPGEAVAMAVALSRLEGTPFASPARVALHKLLAVMPPADAARAGDLAGRVHLVKRPDDPPPPAPVPSVVGDALVAGRVLDLGYIDRNGEVTRRLVEPMGWLSGRMGWYLVAWCRMRDAARMFRMDRLTDVRDTGEPAPLRELRRDQMDIPDDIEVHALAFAA
ncbi:transcriptional regulator [Virgisporangium aliadipatigenens]|uniref:Transcriptional regulator n=1 Tax=Virgisporangium aliadipatigenens TaxID=741659 RepID=A0A8J3YVH4_9ACTN|nr:WYL domain-containing protein [Virgisporangium aliadipatigenens]GIJ50468.1 transcriptional regulator [Virgisporangium aliadipatigenens]